MSNACHVPHKQLGRIACTQCTDAAYCYRCSVVCVLVATMSYAETAEAIEVSFGVWSEVGPRNHILGAAVILPQGKGQF